MGQPRRSYPSLVSLDATGPEHREIPPVLRSHQADGCLSILEGNSDDSCPWEVLCTMILALLRATDPVVPVQYYRRVMPLYLYEDALLWRVFPASLGEGAIAWFQQFLCDIITSFTDLSTRFAQAYALHIWEPKQTGGLFEIDNLSQESQKQYVDRFKATLRLILILINAWFTQPLLRG